MHMLAIHPNPAWIAIYTQNTYNIIMNDRPYSPKPPRPEFKGRILLPQPNRIEASM